MKLLKLSVVATLLLSGVLATTGCKNKGPAEKTGERIDEAGRDTKRAIQDAAD